MSFSCSFRFAPENSGPIRPNLHPQTMAPQGLLAQRLQPCEGVQKLQGDVFETHGEKCKDRFLFPANENH